MIQNQPTKPNKPKMKAWQTHSHSNLGNTGYLCLAEYSESVPFVISVAIVVGRAGLHPSLDSLFPLGTVALLRGTDPSQFSPNYEYRLHMWPGAHGIMFMWCVNETWEDSPWFTTVLSDGCGRTFLKKKSLFVPWDFSHFLADNTVFYSSRIKLSVCALYVCLQDAKQTMGTIAGGRKTHLNENLQRRSSLGSLAPASTPRTTSHTFFFFLRVISHRW